MNTAPFPSAPVAASTPDWPARFRGARVLLLSPHPDDESLAMGGLIQHVVRAGAQARVVLMTDGDNNPWPQRWLERRLRIGPQERRRWGRRRDAEMLQALRCLGLDASSRRRLGWPDMGVTRQYQTEGMSVVQRMVDVVREVDPHIVVMPTWTDSHPDHGVCHVLARLALAREAFRGDCLTYQVHGGRPCAGKPVSLSLDERMQAGKREAVLCHRTQVALARKRLLAHVGDAEQFHAMHVGPATGQGAGIPEAVALPWHPPRAIRPWLQLTLAHPDGVHVWRWNEAPLAAGPGGHRLTLPAEVSQRPWFAKLELRCRSPWIFDHWGWHDLTVAPPASQASGLQR